VNQSGKSFEDYIDNADGFSKISFKWRFFVCNANDPVAGTAKTLFFNNFRR